MLKFKLKKKKNDFHILSIYINEHLYYIQFISFNNIEKKS